MIDREEQKEIVKEQVERLPEYEFMHLHNRVCDEWNYCDSYIYDNQDEDFLNDILGDKSPVEILRMASNGDYNVGHNFVRFNGYGNLVSSNDVFALGFSSDEIADFLIENEEVADEWDIDVPEICTDPLSEEF